ncbi:hypothetical protein DY000_02044408 [Brassica cretica]|uniref:Uncharacterized protein n=1 Tax=Brassica cretica TaxID=69181 RepID=A0ABQ7EU18_BRACR|nr:hypothetical protein DY000_02044408 [Brassica cretica]
MESGIEAPLPSEKQSISCALAVESTSLALSSALTSTMTSASSSSTSLALTVSSTESLEVVNTLSTTSSFAPMNTSLGSPVVILSPSSSPVQTSSTLTFASPMTSSTVSSDLINTISGTTAQDVETTLILGTDQNCDINSISMELDSLKEPESFVVLESDIAQVSSHQDDCNVPHNRSLSSENGMQAPPKFVPTLGAWAKPLLFKPPATPPQPSTPRDYDPAIVGNQLASLWPSLNDEILNKKPKSSHQTRTLQLPIEKLPPSELKADGKVRFPWAARLSPQSRNLYRAANLTYRLDGTPQISIPSKVLKLGPENKDEYIIGKFHRCTLPPGGLVHAVANRIWGRSCKISCKKIGESTYMFHIPHRCTLPPAIG